MRWRSCCATREWMCGNRWCWPRKSEELNHRGHGGAQRNCLARPRFLSLRCLGYRFGCEVAVRCDKIIHGLMPWIVFFGEGRSARMREKQGVLTENLWPKLFSEAPRCAPLRLFVLEQTACRSQIIQNKS